MSANEGMNGVFASTARRGWFEGPLTGAVVLALWGFLSLGVIARVTLPLSTFVAPGGADPVGSPVQRDDIAPRQATSLISDQSAFPQLAGSPPHTELTAAVACTACQDCLDEVARASNAAFGR
jgi:hypothetical protein